MLSENLKLQARRLLKSTLRAHVYREKVRQDPSYEKWDFLTALEAETSAEWYIALEGEQADPQDVTRYIIAALPDCIATIAESFGNLGVSIEAELVTFLTLFEPLDLLPKRTLH